MAIIHINKESLVKKQSNNNVIDLNIKQNPDKTKFDYLNCFEGSDNDSIIDYY